MISRFRFIARLRRSFFPSNTYLGLTSPFGLSTHPSNWPVVYRSSSNVAVKTSVSSQSVATHRSQANVLQTIDAHRVSSLLLDREARSRRFSEMWDFLMSSPDTNILTVNAYLFAKLDCGLDVDRGSVLNDLQEKGLTPNTRTYSSFIHQCCSKGDMEETSSIIQELKQANLKPDAYIFSQILYGYAKAGLTEEVASVQELMGRLLLWPSRIAYESLLSAYAELGDHSSLLRILKEALEVLPEYTGHTVARTVPGSSPFSSRFLVNLYVQSNCFSTDSFPVCTELLTQLPSPPDVLTRRCVRGGVKRLLAHGQLNAALDLFAYGEPKNLDDPYLTSLWRYAVAGGLGPDAVEDFWKLANVSGARLSALRKHIFRSKPSTVLDLRLKLKDAFARKDVDAVFATVKAHPTDARDTMCNYITQELLRLGLSPAEIIDRLQSPLLKSCAAFGSVLASLSADSTRDESISAHLDTVSSMISQFVQQGHLPMKGPIYSLYAVSRKILQHALVSHSSPDQYLCHVLDLLSRALSPNQLATVVDQMFASTLLHRFAPSSGLKPALSADDLKMVQALVKACLTKGIQFPPDSWLFHSLESCELDKTELESLKFPMDTRSDRADDMSKKTPLWRTVQHELLSGNVNGVIELIKDFTRDSEPPLEPGQRTSKIQFPDVVNIAFDALTKPTKGSPAITATDVEHLFWACWDSKLLNQAGVAVARVASAYLRTSDFEGMAAYFQRASKQLGALQDFLLEPHFMKPLLEANFSDNLILLQSMASHPYLPITQFAVAAHNLAKLVALFPDKVTNAANWQHGSDQYWPVQVLSRRFSGLTHLGKLRTIHNTITDLCSSGRLQTAHSLRMWASQLGLLIFPKTNEHLTLTTQLLLSYDRLHALPQSLLTHGLSQHHPVNLDNRLLASFDSTLLVPLGDDQLPDANAVKAVAGWLHEHILPNAIDADNLTARYLPTWLVICQRMLQSGSAFVSPKSWTSLSSEWLNGAYTMTTNAVTQLNDWYTYAASDSHKAALLLSALSNPNSQEWGLSQLRSDSFMVYRLLGLFDPASVLTVDQQSHLVAATAAINTGTISELAKVFRDPEVTVDALGDVALLSSEESIKDLARFTVLKPNSLSAVVDFLSLNHPSSLLAFFDYFLTDSRQCSHNLRFVRECYHLMHKLSINPNALNVENRAFLHAAFHVVKSSRPSDLLHPLGCLRYILPADIRDSWINDVHNSFLQRNYLNVVRLLESLDPPVRNACLPVLLYSSHALNDLIGFTSAVVGHSDIHMLEQIAFFSRPFAPIGLPEALSGFAAVLNGDNVDWLRRACIRFRKLGEFLSTKSDSRTPIREDDRLDLTTELTQLLKRPISSIVQSILNVRSDPVKLSETLDQLISTCSLPRKMSIVNQLVVEGAKDVVSMIAHRYPGVISNRPYAEFAEIVGHSEPNSATSAASAALEQLDKLEPKVLPSCFKGPHAEILFRKWPETHLSELSNLITGTSKHDRTSLTLQFAAILVNRGFRRLADSVMQGNGPIPIAFLAGSPRHTLSPSELEPTLAYLREADPDHLYSFLDICVRNAVSPGGVRQSTHLVNLIRALTSREDSFNLKDICTVPTINAVTEFIKRCPNIPSDVKEQLSGLDKHWITSIR